MSLSFNSTIVSTEGAQKNSTMNNTTSPLCEMTEFRVCLLVGYMGVFVIGIIGNSLVLIYYKNVQRSRTIIELLILYLASFDLMSSILDPLIFGYWTWTCGTTWHFGFAGCKILPPLCRVSTNVSIGILLIMAIDRCYVILKPLHGHFKRLTVHACILVTVVLACASEVHYVNALYISDGLCELRQLRLYLEYSYPLVALVSLRVLAILLILVFTTLASTIKLNGVRRSTLVNDTEQLRRMTKSRYKVTRMIVVMTTIFAVAVLPRDLLHLVHTITWITPGEGINKRKLIHVNNVLKLLQTSNAIYNVFIYGGMNSQFRQKITSLFLCKSFKAFTKTISTSRRNNDTIVCHELTENPLLEKNNQQQHRGVAV